MNTTGSDTPEGTVPSLHPALAAAPRRRRRWWVYALWVVGTLFVLGLALILSVALYWNHLIKTYTSTQAKEVPTVEATDERYDELRERWEAYALLYLRPQERPEFEMTTDELNVFLSRFGPLRKRAHVEVRADRLRVRFCAPLGASGNPSLAGRYLNGVADVKMTLAKGRVSVRLLSLEANGKPIPGWILRRMQRMNWGEQLNHRPEFDLVVRGLETIEFRDGTVILRPKPGLVPQR